VSDVYTGSYLSGYGSGPPVDPGDFLLTATRVGSVVELSASGAPATGTITVRRVTPDDVLVRMFIDQDIDPGDTVERIDHETPQNVAVTYRAYLTTPSGTVYESNEAVVAPWDALSDRLVALYPPGEPTLTFDVTVQTQQEQVREAISKPVSVLGDSYPIPLISPRSTWAGSIEIAVHDDTERDAIIDLLTTGHPVALIPRRPEYGVSAVEYLAIKDVVVSRVSTLPTNATSTIALEAISIVPPPYRGAA
jgi:hypothetical protein